MEHQFFNGIDWDMVLNKEYQMPIPEKRSFDVTSDLTKSVYQDLKTQVKIEHKKSR